MTFADWQFSKGIVPWVIVHDFSEAAYLRWQMKNRMRFTMRRITEPFVEAMSRIAEAVTTAASALADFAAVASGDAGAHGVPGDESGSNGPVEDRT